MSSLITDAASKTLFRGTGCTLVSLVAIDLDLRRWQMQIDALLLDGNARPRTHVVFKRPIFVNVQQVDVNVQVCQKRKHPNAR